MRIAVFATDDFIPPVGGAEVAMGEIIRLNPEISFDLYVPKLFKGRPKIQIVGNATIRRFGFANPKIDKILFVLFAPWVARFGRSKETYDACWAMMASYGGFAALFYTWLNPRIRFLLTLQEGDPPEYILKRVRPFGFLFKRIFRRANQIQAISNFLAKWGKDMGFEGDPVVIPNGVDVKKFTQRISKDVRNEMRREMGFAESDVVLVTASRLVVKNGTRHIIESLTLLPQNYKALIIGFGEEREMLEKMVEDGDLAGRVVFLGMRGHEELPALLQSADVFVRPSLSEGLGNSFLEAMAAGLPLIGTPVGGIPDFLKDGETGVFCKPSDPESIAQAVIRIQTQTDLKGRLIENGYRLATEKYNWETIASDMREVFDRLKKT